MYKYFFISNSQFKLKTARIIWYANEKKKNKTLYIYLFLPIHVLLDYHLARIYYKSVIGASKKV